MFDFIYSEVFWMETAIMTGVAAIIGVCVSNRKLGSTVEKKRLELSSEHKDLFREHSGLSREHSGLSREHSDLSKDLTGISSEIGKISNTTYTIEKMFIEEKTKEQGRFDILLRDNDRLDANLQKGINAFGAVKSELVKLQLEIETLKKENNSLIIENSKLKATLNKRIVYKDIEEEQDI